MKPAVVIDATMQVRDGLFCFCPVVLDGSGDITQIVTGMNFISDRIPEGRCLIGVFHEGGQEAVERFCKAHQDEIDALKGAAK